MTSYKHFVIAKRYFKTTELYRKYTH